MTRHMKWQRLNILVQQGFLNKDLSISSDFDLLIQLKNNLNNRHFPNQIETL